MKVSKAIHLYDIMNVTDFNTPIEDDKDDEFFTDFSGFRKGFNEKKLFRALNIVKKDANKYECQDLNSIQRIFLSGHRGTGKTTELFKLQKEIDSTKCFLTIFCDVGNNDLDTNNIDFVDIVIFMIEKLVETLKDKGIEINQKDIETFYSWYDQTIKEINTKNDSSAYIEAGIDSSVGLMGLFSVVSKTRAKFKASQETKETIRNVFTNKFSDFSSKFNEFIANIQATLQKQDIAQNILFVVDGFEKIGTLEDRKKIIIDNSNKFIEIRANMILSLPIELFSQASILSNFAKPISFPLIELDEKGIEKFEEFIYKRVDENLFEDENTVKEIIKYGAGNPRETLKIIKEAYLESDSDDMITYDSVIEAKNSISNQIVNYLTKEEFETIKEVYNNNGKVDYSEDVAELLVKRVLLDYGNNCKVINPIVFENSTIQRKLKIKQDK